MAGSDGTLRFGLGALIEPLSSAAFLSEVFPERVHVARGHVARFAELLELPEMLDLARLAAANTSQVRVWSDTAAHALVSAAEAMQLHAAGKTLYFRDVEKAVPALMPLVRGLERDLGLLTGSICCEAFASRAGTGASMHFDFDHAFNLQLRGHKRWWIAPNSHVVNPTKSFNAGAVVPEALQHELRTEAPLPRAMPPDAEVHDVAPGSVIWLPRGRWHQTRVEPGEDSFCLIFAVRPGLWLDHLLVALRRKLLADPRWREAAFGLAGDAEQWSVARARAATLLEVLRGDPLSPEEVLSAELPSYIAPPWSFVPSSIASPHDASGPLGDVVRWALARARPFSGIDARAAFPHVLREDLEHALRALVEAGALLRSRRDRQSADE